MPYFKQKMLLTTRRQSTHREGNASSCCSSVDSPFLRKALLKLVATLGREPSLREDLYQEGLIHFWMMQEQRPGQTLSWYLQSCRFHFLNYLAQGRSVDSQKRLGHRACLTGQSESMEAFERESQFEDSNFELVSTRDLVECLSRRMKPGDQAVLGYLVEGLGIREIAKKLGISHQAVSKHRQSIAALAVILGVSPAPRRSVIAA